MNRDAIGALVGSGRVAEIFAYGDGVLKLYRSPDAKADAFREAAALAIAASHGLAVPEVTEVGTFDGRWGLAMGRAPGTVLAELGVGREGEVVAEMVRLHRLIHAKSEARLPSLKERLATRIGQVTQLDSDKHARLLGKLNLLPDGDHICHGDFHPFNIMGMPGTVIVVDWLDATSGPSEADVCRSYVLLMPHMPSLAEAYLAAYCAASGCERSGVLAWLEIVAAARLAEGTSDEPWLLDLLHGMDSS
ncbi:MAG TPA: aminoglycoside phosphotransferase family protein [Devosia sp.]|nr:aminoglycoside phosphotransferase family protein [Devosia sp.]